jgi:nitrogen regulatory protein PII
MRKQFSPALIKSKLISAILPKGVALSLIRKLKEEKNINIVTLNYARGTGKLIATKHRKNVVEREQEILTVIVEEERCEEIFEYIYEQANINKAHGGLMYMHPLIHSTEYLLPDILEEEV